METRAEFFNRKYFIGLPLQIADDIWQFPARVAIDIARRGNFYMAMKHFILAVTFIAAVAGTPPVVRAQTNSPETAVNVNTADKEKAALEKRDKAVLAALNLDDAAKAAKVRESLAAWFAALKTWHAANDAQIKPLWNEFNEARSAQNAANVSAALAKIDGVYASFKPQHEKFLSDLSSVLTPEQVETVKDVLTVNKVKVTYDVYLQIFPTLTDAQKAMVLQNLKAAREQAIDCEAMTEKSAFFKKFKIKIEDEYLTAQGYNPKQARKDFAAKQKADAAGKKSAAE